jgi:NADH-quinone oxidoreductase subunit J
MVVRRATRAQRPFPDPRLLQRRGLFLIAGPEFLAMILVIVYVGAVAVLFLFVVMMLDVDFTRMREGFQRYAPRRFGGRIMFIEICFRSSSGGTSTREPRSRRRFQRPTYGVNQCGGSGSASLHDYVSSSRAAGLILLCDDRRHRADPAERHGTPAQDIARSARAGTVTCAGASGAGLAGRHRAAGPCEGRRGTPRSRGTAGGHH